MAMTKREKMIAISAAAVLGVFALDYFVLTPFFKSRENLVQQRLDLQQQLTEANSTVDYSHAVARRWVRFQQAGLRGDASATENNLLNEMRKWSQESGLTLVSLRPDRAVSEKGLAEMTFQATAQGNMRAVSQFMYKVETTQLPIRIREAQIASRSDATDDLSLQLRISTLWDDASSK